MGSKKRLPQMAGGSASALSLSRPAQASLTLRPAGSLSRPQATFVTRLQPMRLRRRRGRSLGPRTRRAVMAFQRQRGLEPSGQIDQQTATALGLSIASTSGRSVTGPQ